MAMEWLKAKSQEQWKQQTLKYDGPDIKIKLKISNKIFETSTNVLFNKKHGVTLFIHEFLGIDKNSINRNCYTEDNKQQTDTAANSGNLFKVEQVFQDKMDKIYHKKEDNVIQLYFDRDPELFHYILNYLRGYPIEHELYALNVLKLEKLLSDAKYFKLVNLEEIIMNALYSRFNPYLCASPLIMAISDNGRRVTRTATKNEHNSCSVYGTLYTGTRYVEFDIVTHGNRRYMIGVTEAKQFRTGPYPGHPRVKGISLYGNDGFLYRNGEKEEWSASFHHGDRVGVLVKISDDKTSATITFYINGDKIRNALNLKQYMNIDNGVVFIVNMHDTNEEVQIIQNPEVPTLLI